MARSPLQYDPDEIDRLESVLQSDINDSRAHFSTALRIIRAWERYYDPEREADEDELPWEHAWMGHNPFVKTSHQTLLRKVIAACFPDPQFHFEYPQHQIEDACEVNMQAILMASEYERVFMEQVDAGLRQGFCVKWLRWDTRREYVSRPRWTGRGFDESEQVETVYDLPRYEVIKPENLIVIPAHDADLQDSEAVGHRYVITGADLDDGINAGLYDREKALQVLAQTTGHQYETTFEDDRWHVHPQQPYDGNPTDWRNRTLTLTMLYRYCAKPNKPRRQYRIILAEDNGGMILSMMPVKTVSGRKPYSNFRPFTRARGIFGDSVASNGGAYTEDVLTLMGRFLVWASQLGIDPVLFVGQRFFEDFDKNYDVKKFRRPGALFPVDEELLKEGGMKPFIPGWNPQILLTAMEHFVEVGREGTGASRNDSGERIPGATATEVAQIAAARQTLDGFVIQEAARTQDEDARQIHGMVQQHYESESVQKIWQRVNGKRVISIPVPGEAMQLAGQMPPGTIEKLLTERLLQSIAHPDKFEFPPKIQQALPQPPQPQALPAPGQPPTQGMPQGQPGQPQPPPQQAPAPLPPHIVNIPIPIEVIHADFEITSNAGPEQGDSFARAQKAIAHLQLLRTDPAWGFMPAKYQYEAIARCLKEGGVQNPEDYLGTIDEYEQAKDKQAQSAMQMMQMEIEAKHGGKQKPQSDPQAEQAKLEHEQQLKEAELALKAKVESEKNKTALIKIAADHANNIQQAAQQADAAEHSQAMDLTNAALKAHQQAHGQAMAEHSAGESADQQDFSQAQQTQSAEQAQQAQQFTQQQAEQQAAMQQQRKEKAE